MCKECGCGLPGKKPVGISAHRHSHEHEHGHGHSHTHDHDHQDHDHGHSHEADAGAHRTLEVRRAILDKNDRLAERNRGFFHAHGLLVLNILSSPGSGKTTFIRETIRLLGKKLKTGVIVGDLATDNDAERLRETGAPVVQITTGTVCHLEAEMVAHASEQLDLKGLELLIIENVGNLVCPASYDLGEDLRVVLLSVTEGEDKPLKYPPLFRFADVVVLTKIDLLPHLDYDRSIVLESIRKVNSRARIFELSSRTGVGLDEWCDFLKNLASRRI